MQCLNLTTFLMAIMGFLNENLLLLLVGYYEALHCYYPSANEDYVANFANIIQFSMVNQIAKAKRYMIHNHEHQISTLATVFGRNRKHLSFTEKQETANF